MRGGQGEQGSKASDDDRIGGGIGQEDAPVHRGGRGVRAVTSMDPAELLALTSVVTAPAITAALQTFAPAQRSRGLDVGCGIGTQTKLLADAVGPDGRVTGLDASPQMLARARVALEERRHEKSRAPIDLVAGDLSALPFADGTFDWLWCADTLWPGMVVDDPVPAVHELARVVRPGGALALLYWSGQHLLPGRPALEARLDAAFATATPYMAAPPQRHFSRAVGWLRDAGLDHVVARTFVADHHAPLEPRTQQALAACIAMLWGGLQERLSPSDRSEFEALCTPTSPDFILHQHGYAGTVTYTMFTAEVS